MHNSIQFRQIDPACPCGLGGSVTGAVTAHIRDNDLMTVDQRPGEATLARDMNVSRTLLREALHSLAAMRGVELQAGKGVTIC